MLEGVVRLDRLHLRSSRPSPCRAPRGSADDYLRLWHEARSQRFPAIDAYERECGAAIDRSWFEDAALLTQVTVKANALCYQHGRLLYATLRRYIRDHGGGDLNIVETGTARGFSALCLAKALADAGASGKIVTFDVLPHDQPMYWNCIRDADGPRTRAELLREYRDLLERYVVFHCGDTRLTLSRIVFPRVHFAFLDSVHTYSHVMAEFAAIRGAQQPGDVLFFDDYTPATYPGVVKAADEICRTAGYSGTAVVAHEHRRYLLAEKA